MQNRLEAGLPLEVPYCMMCEQTKEQGIFILSQYLCEDCEREMVHTDVSQEKYLFFVRKLKQYLPVDLI